jgi:hypothetical protein
MMTFLTISYRPGQSAMVACILIMLLVPCIDVVLVLCGRPDPDPSCIGRGKICMAFLVVIGPLVLTAWMFPGFLASAFRGHFGGQIDLEPAIGLSVSQFLTMSMLVLFVWPRILISARMLAPLLDSQMDSAGVKNLAMDSVGRSKQCRQGGTPQYDFGGLDPSSNPGYG